MRSSIWFLLAAALAVPACRSSSDSPDGGPDADPLSGGTTIYAIQQGEVAVGASVKLEGVVVVTVDKYGGRTGNVYVAEPEGGAYSGVLVFDPEVANGTVDDLTPGDLVTVTGGVVDEYAWSEDTSGKSLTEIAAPEGGVITITKTGAGVVPAAEVVDPVALAADDAEAEKWEGVLITFEDVAVVQAPHGVSDTDDTLLEMSVTGPFAVSTQLTEFAGETPPSLNDCFASVTGIGDYFFTYKILPRGPQDFTLGSGCTYEDSETLCGNDEDDDHDGFTDCLDFGCQEAVAACTVATSIVDIQTGTVAQGTQVAVTGAVVTAVSPDDDLFWIQDAGATVVHGGIAVLYPVAGINDLAPGDVVDVVGKVDEYFGVTELKNVTVTETGTAAVPAPLVVTVEQLTDLIYVEPFEGILVRLEDVEVVTADAGFGEWTVGAVGAEVIVDDMMYRPATITAGDCYDAIQGPFHYSFDKFKIEPRTAADATTGGTCP